MESNKKKLTLRILGIVLILIGIGLFFWLDNLWISFIGFLSGIVSLVISFLSLFEKEKDGEYKDLFLAYKEKYESSLDEKETILRERDKIELQKIEKEKFLTKISQALQKETISKQELINAIDNPLKAILFFKTSEDTSNKRFLLRDKVYSDLGVCSIRAGLAILPPRRVPQNLTNKKLIKWFKKEIKRRLPRGYEFNIPILSIVDIRFTDSIKTLKPFRKIQLSYLDKVPLVELLPQAEAENYLKNKKRLSKKDIIEIPNLPFLVEDYLISKSDEESLIKNNDKIISYLQIKLKIGTIKTTDFSRIAEKEVSDILKKYVSQSKVIASRIKINSKFWKDYFENKVNKIENE